MKPGAGLRVIVAHPGRQHSHRLAAALAREGWLAGYWSGVPARGRWAGDAAGLLPRDVVVSAVWAPATRKLLEAILPASWRSWGDFVANRLFDRWAAARLRRLGADGVVGYEAGCRRLFAVAHDAGIATILDAAAIHPRAQGAWSDEREPGALRRRIEAVKQAEIELAGTILTVSNFARGTYVACGVDPARIQVVRLGVDLDRFAPSTRPADAPFRLCFVGSTLERKGIRELAVAMKAVSGGIPGAFLQVAGAVLGPGAAIRKAAAPGWKFLGKLRGDRLVRLYRESDVLVLPSLEDSFGLVIAEALACGTPVVVSDRTGACDLVEDGHNGWVVPAGDAAALAGRLLWIGKHLGEVRSMRPRCAASVRRLDWSGYSRDLIETLRPVLRIGHRR